jgi:glycosyltransferase involved in cell wall biosynthesis
MSLRILYHHRIRSDDGQAVHVRELIGALRAEGHEVLECALVPKANGESSQPRETSERARPGFWQQLSLPRTAVEALEIAYGSQGARRIVAAAREFRPHFIYERHALHCDSGLRAARELGVPLLLEVNSPLCDEMQRLGLLRFARRARRTEERVLGGADVVFAVTDVLRGLLVERGARPDRTRVVPNGVLLERYGDETRRAASLVRQRLGLGSDAFVLGFVGYMRDWHRLDLAVELLASPGFENVRLVLAGDGPARKTVLEVAERLGVTSRVHALGVVAPDELPAHVMAFDAALIPAINGYASPLKLFDSLAAGVATLAPRQPNLEETIDDGVDGVLFDALDGGALREALHALVEDREKCRAIGEAGRARLLAEDWTWRGNARRVVAAYEALAPAEVSP